MKKYGVADNSSWYIGLVVLLLGCFYAETEVEIGFITVIALCFYILAQTEVNGKYLRDMRDDKEKIDE